MLSRLSHTHTHVVALNRLSGCYFLKKTLKVEGRGGKGKREEIGKGRM